MMELHSTLLLISILSIIFLLTYFISVRPKKELRKIVDKQEPRFDLAATRVLPVPEAEDYHQSELHHAENPKDDANLLLDDPLPQPAAHVRNNSDDSCKKKSAVEEILYLILAAKPHKPYLGYELLQALLAVGLRFGAMNIFHHYTTENENNKILFSVACASEPGTFEINKMGAFSGKGLVMFLRLSNNKDLMLAFETMLETATQLIEDLDGEILDDERKILSPDKIEKMKKKILGFEQKQFMGDLFDSRST
jgi:cell division protein ZipA